MAMLKGHIYPESVPSAIRAQEYVHTGIIQSTKESS